LPPRWPLPLPLPPSKLLRLSFTAMAGLDLP